MFCPINKFPGRNFTSILDTDGVATTSSRTSQENFQTRRISECVMASLIVHVAGDRTGGGDPSDKVQ